MKTFKQYWTLTWWFKNNYRTTFTKFNITVKAHKSHYCLQSKSITSHQQHYSKPQKKFRLNPQFKKKWGILNNGLEKNIHKQVEFTPLNPQIVYPTLLFEGALCSFSSLALPRDRMRRLTSQKTLHHMQHPNIAYCLYGKTGRLSHQ